METSFIRLQVSSEGLFESRTNTAYGKSHKGIYDHSSIVFLLVKDNPETLKVSEYYFFDKQNVEQILLKTVVKEA